MTPTTVSARQPGGLGVEHVPTRVVLPNVHMAGSDAHYDAHFDVTRHGFSLFLMRDAEFPVLDINGTPSQLDDVLRALHAGIDASRALADDSGSSVQLDLPR